MNQKYFFKYPEYVYDESKNEKRLYWLVFKKVDYEPFRVISEPDEKIKLSDYLELLNTFAPKPTRNIVNGMSIEGNNIVIKDNKIFVDGKLLNAKNELVQIETININGNVKSLQTTSGNVVVNGKVTGNVKTTSGKVTAKDVGGNIHTTSGSVSAGTVNGTVETKTGSLKMNYGKPPITPPTNRQPPHFSRFL